MPDVVATILSGVNTSTAVRADAWDAVHQATDSADLERRLNKLPFSNEIRAQLWDARFGQPAPPSILARAIPIAATAMPLGGGIIGGIVGGKTGSAIGGAAGEGYRQLLDHATELPGAVADVARTLMTQPKATLGGFVSGAVSGTGHAVLEGATQAAGQAIGEGMAAGGGILAKWLMNRATSRVTAKLAADFPELSDTLIDHALTVSEGGYAKARTLLTAAKSKATAALVTADATGAKVSVELTPDLAESLKTALLEKAIKSGRVPIAPGTPLTIASRRLDPTTAALFTDIDTAVAKGGPFDLAPSQADVFKTQLQKESRLLYANRVAPNGQRAMGMDATERAEYATQLNTAIDQLASGYKAANAEAQPLIGAVRGIKQAIRPSGNLYQAMVRPAVGAVLGEEAGRRSGVNPIASGLAGAVLTSPAGMSREAIILAHPAMQQALKQLPKPTAQALADFVTTHLVDQPIALGPP